MSELSEEISEATDKKLPAKDVVHDSGVFQHETGDRYEGEFEAKKKDMSIKMHGQGVYTTAEGDTYTGTWDANQLGAGVPVTITFRDGSTYEGSFKDWSYSGKGVYHYPDETMLRCDFAENCPVGPLKLVDPNGHTWLGKAELGICWFEPVNHYYDMLESTQEVVSKRGKKKKVQK